MLVLSRMRDETIVIGEDVQVTVVDIRGDKVRLGITAPREVSVHRKEVYDAIRRETLAAAAGPATPTAKEVCSPCLIQPQPKSPPATTSTAAVSTSGG